MTFCVANKIIKEVSRILNQAGFSRKDINSLIKGHYGNVELAKQSIKDEPIAKGIDTEKTVILEQRAHEGMDLWLKDKRTKYIENFVKNKKLTPYQRKTLVSKIVELSNTGALNTRINQSKAQVGVSNSP